ncbi:hypothetical protein AMTRI_Chr07g30730 [Amborella trichopoda]
MKLFVLFPLLKFCTGSSERIQKRELYFNSVFTDLPPDALTVDFCIALAFFTFTGKKQKKRKPKLQNLGKKISQHKFGKCCIK